MPPAGDGSLPPQCGPERIVHTVTGFLDAVNTGNQAGIRRFLDLRGLETYVVVGIVETGRSRGKQATEINPRDASKVVAYLEHRHERKEEMHLHYLAITHSIMKRQPSVAITYDLTRTANDLKLKGNSSAGKGLVDCKEEKIFRWVQDGNSYLDLPAGAVYGCCFEYPHTGTPEATLRVQR